jgi:exosome complex RNA-binding protein Rrp42 (RNase PH superfamily)
MTGTFTDEPIKGYEELMSLADTNTVTVTFMDTTSLTVTLMTNTQIAFIDASSITSSGNIIVS